MGFQINAERNIRDEEAFDPGFASGGGWLRDPGKGAI
jgi:hypothetical protein